MKAFMDEHFLLQTPTAQTLYHDFAAKMPIVDYHCHIDPKDIADDRKYENITQVWLYGDHYKWRAMRFCGVDEYYITGGASDYERFQKWAETMPRLIGSPLYHWTHLELQRYFGVYEPLSPATCDVIWNTCNEVLQTLTVREIIKKSNVRVICTTDDPVSDLAEHKRIAASVTEFKVFPAFRPDKAINLHKAPFADYIKSLSACVGYPLNTFADLKRALKERIDYFHAMGCRACDHGVDLVPFALISDKEVEKAYKLALAKKPLTREQIDGFQTALMLFLAREYHARNWVMEIHYGVIRDANAKTYAKMGPDTGFDTIGTASCEAQLAKLLDTLEQEDKLPKTILFSINPADNEALNTLSGCFSKAGIANRVQQGSGWWFNDNLSGMQAQLQAFANLSVLGNFAGMLTDSRSFLSYTRHEYFRRILCNYFGNLVENGEYPADMETLGQMVQDICYNNAMRFFEFEEE